MKLNFKSIAAASLLALVTSCGGGGADALADDMEDTIEDIVEILEGIETKEDAVEAKDDLADAIEEMNSLAKKSEELSEEEKKELEGAKTDEEMKELMSKWMAEMGRVMRKPEIASVLEPVMAKMEQ